MTDAGTLEAFDAMYRANYDDLLRFAVRRTANPADAADVVADVMTVAWRRRAGLPAQDECRLWFFGVARNVLANQRRGEVRRSLIAARLRDELLVAAPRDPQSDSPMLEALATLREADRELLTLTAWEGLRPEEVATVLQCSPAAARVRLHRARRRLRSALEAGAPTSTMTSALKEAT